MSKLKDQRRKNNLCAYCGGPMDREGYYCTKCNDLNNFMKYVCVEQYHEDGICTTCRKPMDRVGWLCSECLSKLNNRAKIRSAERRSLGLCVQCGQPSQGFRYCQRCRDQRMDRYNKKKNK